MTVRFWQGLAHRVNTPEGFDRFGRTEIATLSNVVKAAGIKAQQYEFG